MHKKTNPIIVKTTSILAVQMLIFIGSFYWLYKALNTHFEYIVGGGDRISNFLMAKEVNKMVKKKLQHQCPTIKYYENTKYTLNRKVTKKIHTIVMCLSSSRKCRIFFPRNWNAPQTEYRCRMWMYCQFYGHIFEIFPYI